MNKQNYVEKLNEEIERLKQLELYAYKVENKEAQTVTSRIYGVQFALNLARELD